VRVAVAFTAEMPPPEASPPMLPSTLPLTKLPLPPVSLLSERMEVLMVRVLSKLP
jgi:hypothetical protein